MSSPAAGVLAESGSVPIEGLARSVREHIGADARIVEARVASAGMSDDTWMVTVTQGGKRTELVVRRQRPGGPLREHSDPERHFRLLEALVSQPVPAPVPLWYEPDADLIGGPSMAARKIEGTVVVPWSRSGRQFLRDAGAGRLGESFVATLAAIHACEWQGRELDLLAVDGVDPAEDAGNRIAVLRAAVERYQVEPEPVLVDALCWLEANRPEPRPAALVHGDYRTGNVVFGPDRINGVLDWEFARLGDPTSDLGWLLGPTNRLGSDLAAYILPRERILELYERHAGWAPSRHSLHFWEVLNLVFNTCLWMSGGFNYESGLTDDLILARWSYTLPKMRRLLLDALEGR
jgi:aminoglycoside phosphotransferase (APT) family kinase protein